MMRSATRSSLRLLMRTLKDGAAILLLCAAAVPVYAQSPSSQAAVEFQYENAKQQLAKYVILVREDGTGHFHAAAGEVSPDDIAALPQPAQDRDIHISKAATERIFTIARQKKFFAMDCESGAANIAFQGKKTLRYAGPGGTGSCSYNYSKDAQIQWLTREFEGTASTLDEGRKLAVQHEHGRLSLDAELETLETLVHNGQAVELTNIAPTLREIAGDEAVLQRAQKRARQLLFEADKADAQDKLTP
jgi:hypothetical protein